jgi:hypothetical protein
MPSDPSDVSEPLVSSEMAIDPNFQAAITRLYRLTVYGRWLVVVGLWLTVGIASLWALRYPIGLLREYFTWATVRYGLIHTPIAALGLGLCFGMTAAVLFWQTRNIVWGLPQTEHDRLGKAVAKINQQGVTHPLWQWVWK